MKDIQDSQIFVVGPDRVTTNDRLGPNFVFVTLNFEILDFFQDPHFFQKKVTDQYILHPRKPQFT